MNIRLFDKSAQVRVEACKVLCPMVDSADRGEAAVQKLLQLMNDPTKYDHSPPLKLALTHLIGKCAARYCST